MFRHALTALFVSIVCLAMFVAPAIGQQQRLRATYGGLAPPVGEDDVNDALRALGIDVNDFERLAPLTPPQREAILRIAADARGNAQQRLLDVLDGPARELVDIYFENAPEFGPELGFVCLTERQKHEIRRLTERFREQTADAEGERLTSHLYQAQRELARDIRDILTEEQARVLDDALRARNRNVIFPWPRPGAPQPPGGDAPPQPRIPQRPPVGPDIRYMQIGKVTGIDVENRTLTGEPYTPPATVHVSPDRLVVVVDGAEAKLDDLKVDLPVLAFSNIPGSLRSDLVVQQSDGKEAVAISGRVRAAGERRITLTDAPIPHVTLAPTTLVRNDVGPIAATAIPEGHRVLVVGVPDPEGFRPLVVIDRGPAEGGYRLATGILNSVIANNPQYSMLTIRWSVPQTITFTAAQDVDAVDFAQHGAEPLIGLEGLKTRLDADEIPSMFVYYRQPDGADKPEMIWGRIYVFPRPVGRGGNPPDGPNPPDRPEPR